MKQVSYNYKAVQDYINQKGITIKKFCQMCNISYSQYRRIATNKNVHVGALYRVALTLNIPFYKIFDVEGGGYGL